MMSFALAVIGGLAAGAPMSFIEQGMAKALVPAAIIAVFAFLSTFATGVRKRTAMVAWVAGALIAGVAGVAGRYLELARAAQQVAGEASEIALSAALEQANLPLMAAVFAVAAFVVALVPAVLGAATHPRRGGDGAPGAVQLRP